MAKASKQPDEQTDRQTDRSSDRQDAGKRGAKRQSASRTTKLPGTVMTVFLYSEGDLHSERDVGPSTLGNRGEGMDHRLRRLRFRLRAVTSLELPPDHSERLPREICGVCVAASPGAIVPPCHLVTS